MSLPLAAYAVEIRFAGSMAGADQRDLIEDRLLRVRSGIRRGASVTTEASTTAAQVPGSWLPVRKREAGRRYQAQMHTSNA